MWREIEPEMILYIFLPVLLFGEAMSLKWHTAKGGFWQSFLLAGPGVVIGVYAMSWFVYYLDFGWSWNLCMLFGSIVSTTDPVAVVAILKSSGASPKLTLLIVGESLMNDGSAMVLFTLYFNLLKGEEYTINGLVFYFIKMIIGAPILGCLFGLVCVFWLSTCDRKFLSEDITVQIAITFVCAYMSFFTANYICEVSGVLACCAAGLMFAWKAPSLILEHESMHHVWGIFEWLGNTLIFLLAGIIIGGETLKRITVIDWVYLCVIYVVLMLLRAAIILLLYPLLSNVGLKCTAPDAMFMAWAGLRGNRILSVLYCTCFKINYCCVSLFTT